MMPSSFIMGKRSFASREGRTEPRTKRWRVRNSITSSSGVGSASGSRFFFFIPSFVTSVDSAFIFVPRTFSGTPGTGPPSSASLSAPPSEWERERRDSVSETTIVIEVQV